MAKFKETSIGDRYFRYANVADLISAVNAHVHELRSDCNRRVWELEREVRMLREQAANRHEMRINAMMQSQEEMGRAMAKLSDNTSHAMRMYLDEAHKGRIPSQNLAMQARDIPNPPVAMRDIAPPPSYGNGTWAENRAARQQEKSANLAARYNAGPAIMEKVLKGKKS